MQEEVGFIFTRHVNSHETNRYWMQAYDCIRTVYPTMKILIIDDNSNREFVNQDKALTNCQIIISEYPGCGEILAYYYFYILKPFAKAIISHDSTFLNRPIDKIDAVKTVKYLWHFVEHKWDDAVNTPRLIKYLNYNEELIETFNSKNIHGCFGAQSIITHDFLTKLARKYGLFRLVDVVKTRTERMCIERIFALVCAHEDNTLLTDPSMFGCIHYVKYNWQLAFEHYIMNYDNVRDAIMTKVWTGR